MFSHIPPYQLPGTRCTAGEMTNRVYDAVSDVLYKHICTLQLSTPTTTIIIITSSRVDCEETQQEVMCLCAASCAVLLSVWAIFLSHFQSGSKWGVYSHSLLHPYHYYRNLDFKME